MSGNVALDVVIGLSFVFMLYSLFATVLAEMIATLIGLRARNLKEAVDRMLNDEEELNKFYRLLDSLRLMKNPDNKLVNQFYNHPEIKYLGSSGVFRNPSSFKAISFSKTLLYLLNGDGPMVADNVERALRKNSPPILGDETKEYVISLWEDSQGDLMKFKLQLEAWFDRTMEQCLEWYKRKIQVILMLIGFGIAWVFNADTFVIVKKLSTDRDARENMVSLASSYLENNPLPPPAVRASPATRDTAASGRNIRTEWDSLVLVKKRLEEDIRKANTILGSGGWLQDSLVITSPMVYAGIESHLLPKTKLREIKSKKVGEHVVFAFKDKARYFLALAVNHFFGFLVMAIAVSLGAPFWFDLLNKLMKLRTSVKQETDTAKYSTTLRGAVPPLEREG